MHIAMQLFGYGALLLLAIAVCFYFLSSRDTQDDSWVGGLVTLFFGGCALLSGVVWLGLVIFKAANA